MNQYAQQLRRYAEQYPKTSTLALVAATAASCAAMVAFIEIRDRGQPARSGRDTTHAGASDMVTPREAQLAAMLETAKNSTWKQNLENAADAQERFMLPGRISGNGEGTPEYVKRIDERSDEILREESVRREKERLNAKDPLKTQFWK